MVSSGSNYNSQLDKDNVLKNKNIFMGSIKESLYKIELLDENTFFILLLNDNAIRLLKYILEKINFSFNIIKIELNENLDKVLIEKISKFFNKTYSLDTNNEIIIKMNEYGELLIKINELNSMLTNYNEFNDILNEEPEKCGFNKSLFINELPAINEKTTINNNFKPVFDKFILPSYNIQPKKNILEGFDCNIKKNTINTNIKPFNDKSLFHLSDIKLKEYYILYINNFNISIIIDEYNKLYNIIEDTIKNYFNTNFKITLVKQLKLPKSYQDNLYKILDNINIENIEQIHKRIEFIENDIQMNKNNYNIEIIEEYINKFYTITDSKENKIKSSVLLDQITSYCFNSVNDLGIRNKISKDLLKIGLKKYRLSDGYYYYGLINKETGIIYNEENKITEFNIDELVEERNSYNFILKKLLDNHPTEFRKPLI